MTSLTYVDSSAIVKLVVEEPETRALMRHLEGSRCVVSALARTEVVRAVLHRGEPFVSTAHTILEGFYLMRVSDAVLGAAGVLQPSGVRSLDAIHVATALRQLGEMRELVTYDKRMADAAQAMGMRVASPR